MGALALREPAACSAPEAYSPCQLMDLEITMFSSVFRRGGGAQDIRPKSELSKVSQSELSTLTETFTKQNKLVFSIVWED